MKYIFLKSIKDLKKVTDAQPLLMENEHFLLQFADSIKVQEYSEILLNVQKKNAFFPIIPAPMWKEPAVLRALQKNKIKNICIQIPLEQGPAEKVAWGAQRFQDPSDRSETLKKLIALFHQLKNQFQVTVQIDLNRSALPALYSTLLGIADLKISWVNLNVEKLNIAKDAKVIKEVFKLLRITARTKMGIYFIGNNKIKNEQWNAKTDNLFAGPAFVDIDTANTCTHNCVFCGLYSPQAISEIKKQGGGRIQKNVIELMSARIDKNRCLQFIKDLPLEIEEIQFGGLGDPFTHPHIDDFIIEARKRGFPLYILTNYSYMNKARIRKLHKYSVINERFGIHYCVNISAATPETYQKIRPNQSKQSFKKLIDSLKYTSELARKDMPKGMTFTLMSVTNRLNYKDMSKLVELGKETGALDVWIKPIEVHGNLHMDLLPQKKEYADYIHHVQKTITLADQLKVPLKDRIAMEFLVQQFEMGALEKRNAK